MQYFLQATPGPLVILMRHGKTRANEGSSPLVRAWKDYPLDEDKKWEIVATAEKLRAYNIGYIVSSDLMRDTQTGHIVADVLNQSNKETDFDARTWDVGSFEGQPIQEVNPAIEALYKRSWETPPGSSESFDEFSARWQKFLDRKMYVAANVATMRPTLIITHGKNIALTQTYIDGVAPWEAQMPLPAGYAVISVGANRALTFEILTPAEPVIEDV